MTAANSLRRKISVTAVRIRANPSVVVMTALVPFESTPRCDNVNSESAAAGTLPDASRRATRQSIAPFSPWTTDPLIFVTSA